MDGNTVLGIALIIMQTGWGYAAWKRSGKVEEALAEHTKHDDQRFGELKTLLLAAKV
jgi:hypothetical protein